MTHMFLALTIELIVFMIAVTKPCYVIDSFSFMIKHFNEIKCYLFYLDFSLMVCLRHVIIIMYAHKHRLK